MKTEDYVLIETVLGNVAEMLQEEIVETCDTSKRVDNESKFEIENWNKRFNNVLGEILALKEEMIFTFRIEDDK